MNSIFFALYTACAATWLVVLLTYGRAALASWTIERSSSTPLQEFWAAVKWFVFRVGDDLLSLVTNRVRLPSVPVHVYTPGHMLRLWIGVGALGMSLLTLGTSLVDRSHWSFGLQVIVMVLIATSTAVGLGHVALAWKYDRRWRALVLGVLIWIPLAKSLFQRFFN